MTDFREACCRQYEMGLVSINCLKIIYFQTNVISHRECTRSGFCNFMHLKPISRELRRELYGRRRAAALERRIARLVAFLFFYVTFH